MANYVTIFKHIFNQPPSLFTQNNGPQQLASEATIYVVLEDVNDEIPLFTEREQETVLEGEPIGTKVTQVNAIDKDGTYPNNEVSNKTKVCVVCCISLKLCRDQHIIYLKFLYKWYLMI